MELFEYPHLVAPLNARIVLLRKLGNRQKSFLALPSKTKPAAVCLERAERQRRFLMHHLRRLFPEFFAPRFFERKLDISVFVFKLDNFCNNAFPLRFLLQNFFAVLKFFAVNNARTETKINKRS